MYPRIKAPFGLDEFGRLRAPDEVASGLNCNCVCPGCKAALVAHKGDIRVWHFAHATDSDCKFARETAVHEMAKQILIDHRRLVLPSYLHVGPGRFSQEFSAVRLERNRGENDNLIRPDAICTHDEQELFVEIAVEHFVDKEKSRKLRRHGVPTIEIAIPRLDGDNEWTKTRLEDHVIGNVECKKWVCLPSMLPDIEVLDTSETPFFELWLGIRGQEGSLKVAEIFSVADKGNPSLSERIRSTSIDMGFELLGKNDKLAEILAGAVSALGATLDAATMRTRVSGVGNRFFGFTSDLADRHQLHVQRAIVRNADDAERFQDHWRRAWQPILERISRAQCHTEIAYARARFEQMMASVAKR